MKFHIGDPTSDYTDLCGCVWRDGKRVFVCPRHRHKHGIKPEEFNPRFR